MHAASPLFLWRRGRCRWCPGIRWRRRRQARRATSLRSKAQSWLSRRRWRRAGGCHRGIRAGSRHRRDEGLTVCCDALCGNALLSSNGLLRSADLNPESLWSPWIAAASPRSGERLTETPSRSTRACSSTFGPYTTSRTRLVRARSIPAIAWTPNTTGKRSSNGWM